MNIPQKYIINILSTLAETIIVVLSEVILQILKGDLMMTTIPILSEKEKTRCPALIYIIVCI